MFLCYAYLLLLFPFYLSCREKCNAWIRLSVVGHRLLDLTASSPNRLLILRSARHLPAFIHYTNIPYPSLFVFIIVVSSTVCYWQYACHHFLSVPFPCYLSGSLYQTMVTEFLSSASVLLLLSPYCRISWFNRCSYNPKYLRWMLGPCL